MKAQRLDTQEPRNRSHEKTELPPQCVKARSLRREAQGGAESAAGDDGGVPMPTMEVEVSRLRYHGGA